MNATHWTTPLQRQQNQETIRMAVTRLTRLRRCDAERRRKARRDEFCRSLRGVFSLLRAGLPPLERANPRSLGADVSVATWEIETDFEHHTASPLPPEMARFVIPIALAGELFEHIRVQHTPEQLRELLRAGRR